MSQPNPTHRRVPSPALVISCIALFVALTGSAFALSRGEVKTKHLAGNAVKASKIAKGNVRTPHIRRAAVSGAKIAGGAVTNEKIADGSVWTEKIADGAVRAGKLGQIVVRTASSAPFDGQNHHNVALRSDVVTVLCEPGEIALGGGAEWTNHSDEEDNRHFVSELKPVISDGLPVGYEARGASDEDPGAIGEYRFVARAICLQA